jgi:hypothetical protein
MLFGISWTGLDSGVTLLVLNRGCSNAPQASLMWWLILVQVSQGGPQTITHNLKVIPELAIVKERSDSDSWYVASTELNNYDFLTLNTANLANSDSVTPYIYDLAANQLLR